MYFDFTLHYFPGFIFHLIVFLKILYFCQQNATYKACCLSVRLRINFLFVTYRIKVSVNIVRCRRGAKFKLCMISNVIASPASSPIRPKVENRTKLAKCINIVRVLRHENIDSNTQPTKYTWMGKLIFTFLSQPSWHTCFFLLGSACCTKVPPYKTLNRFPSSSSSFSDPKGPFILSIYLYQISWIHG